MQTYLFYDLETTGLSKPFDQVLQFAAIRTDMALRELERHEFRVRLNRDMIPAPEALLTHHIGINDMQQGMCEYDAIRKIHALFNTPETISLGYNTLGFDDEFLRFSFYKNLLPPYTHQYANKCGRMDLYPITVMFYLFGPECIHWPVLNEKISLKLENINAANQLFAGRAHDAMADVEVTLQLARKFSEHTEMWHYLCGYFEKKTDLLRMQPLQKETALLVQGKMGPNNMYQCPVVFMGGHNHYRNQVLWLRLDTDRLSQTTPESIHETTWSINKKPGEPDFVLPFPSRFDRHLTVERKILAEENYQWLKKTPGIFQKICKYHADFKWPAQPDTDCEASLYLHGLISAEEERFCARFTVANPSEKAALADKAPSVRMSQLATRLLARNFPEHLTAALSEDYAEYWQAIQSDDQHIPVDHQGKKRLTPQAASQTITALMEKSGQSPENQLLLGHYLDWLKRFS